MSAFYKKLRYVLFLLLCIVSSRVMAGNAGDLQETMADIGEYGYVVATAGVSAEDNGDKIHEYKAGLRKDNYWECVTSEDKLFGICEDGGMVWGGLSVATKKGYYPPYFSIEVRNSASEKFAALCKQCKAHDKDTTFLFLRCTATIEFSNGESLTTEVQLSDATKIFIREEKQNQTRAGYFIFFFSEFTYSSKQGNMRSMSPLNRASYVINLLRNYEIKRLTVGNYVQKFNFYPTAATFNAMFKTLEEKTGDSYDSPAPVNQLDAVLNTLKKGHNLNIKMTGRLYKNGALGNPEDISFTPNSFDYNDNRIVGLHGHDTDWDIMGKCYRLTKKNETEFRFYVPHSTSGSPSFFYFDMEGNNMLLGIAEISPSRFYLYSIDSFKVISPIGELLVSDSTDKQLFRQIITAVYQSYPLSDVKL